MLLFMVAQLPGLIPHKLWASPHESTTTNHPTLRLRDLSSLEKGLPCLDKNASPRQDAPAPGMIPTRVAAAECHPSPTSFRLSCQQDHAGDSRSPTAPASCFEYWTQSRFLHHWGHFKVHTPFWFLGGVSWAKCSWFSATSPSCLVFWELLSTKSINFEHRALVSILCAFLELHSMLENLSTAQQPQAPSSPYFEISQ